MLLLLRAPYPTKVLFINTAKRHRERKEKQGITPSRQNWSIPLPHGWSAKPVMMIAKGKKNKGCMGWQNWGIPQPHGLSAKPVMMIANRLIKKQGMHVMKDLMHSPATWLKCKTCDDHCKWIEKQGMHVMKELMHSRPHGSSANLW